MVNQHDDHPDRAGANEALMLGGQEAEVSIGHGPLESGSYSPHTCVHPAAGRDAARSVCRLLDAPTVQHDNCDLLCEPADGPPICEVPPANVRNVQRDAQQGSVPYPAVAVEDLMAPGGPDGDVSVRVFRTVGATWPLPAVMYFRGGGWILGDDEAHDRLVRELADELGAAVVLVNYTPLPEAAYPIAIEQAYAATVWVSDHGRSAGLDASRLVLIGDGVGGNMVAAVTLLAKERARPPIALQVLAYPVTDAAMDSDSYATYADLPWLTANAMRWFWDAYAPDLAVRAEPTASPLRASLEQLSGLPPALLLTDENDVLRDEGEAYARRLEEAGVPVTAVRYLGTIHDFLLLDASGAATPTRAALDQVIQAVRRALST